MTEKILMTWSGGKDSALALHKIQNLYDFDILSLLTTITSDYNRISMHGIRTELLDIQAKSLGYPLEKVEISKNCTNEEYDANIQEVLEKYKDKGIQTVVFGDIFLEDVRKYRENNLSKIGMKGLFPLWKKNTSKLAHEFIKLGFKAIVTCVDSTMIDGSYIGRGFDDRFLGDLPSNVDPCGENGEFHSFVYDGPIFNERINFTKGETVVREKRFYFCDLTLK